MMSNIEDFGKFADNKYIAAVMTRAVLQSFSDVRKQAELFDNPQVLREWIDILSAEKDHEVAVRRIEKSLVNAGIDEKYMRRIVPILRRILRDQAMIVAEVRDKIDNLEVPNMRLATGVAHLLSMVSPWKPLGRDKKLQPIADDISWRIWNNLLDARELPPLDDESDENKGFSGGLYEVTSEPPMDGESKEYPDEELAVWWLSADEVDSLDPTDVQTLPLYIRSELDGLIGRKGRGRLWVPRGIKFDSLKCDFDDPRMSQIDNVGGIVFLRDNLDKVRHVVKKFRVGFLTDVSLERI